VVIENPSAIPAEVNIRVALAEGTANATVAVQAAIPNSHCLIECIGKYLPVLCRKGLPTSMPRKKTTLPQRVTCRTMAVCKKFRQIPMTPP
jgi:hypothetical protein